MAVIFSQYFIRVFTRGMLLGRDVRDVSDWQRDALPDSSIETDGREKRRMEVV